MDPDHEENPSRFDKDGRPVSIFPGSNQPLAENINVCKEDMHDDPPSHENMRAVYRRLDLRIIPALWVLYFLCSAIRANVGLAQTMNRSSRHNLGAVLHLSPRQLSTALALFYASYVVFELPSNLLMSKLSPHVWLARIVISVGIIGTAMVGMKSAASFYVLRLLLGAVEAGLWPGMSLYLTMFYPPQRMAKRVGWYFTASQVSAAVVGLVSAGFQEMDGLRGLVGFQWMFLLWGLVTLIVGFILPWWLPDRPARPGQPVRRDWISRTLHLAPPKPALDANGARLHFAELSLAYKTGSWTMHDLGRVLLDWRFWPLLVMYFGVVGVGNGIQSYGTVLLSAINPRFTGVQLSLLYAPIWICDLIGILVVTPISDRFHRHRALFFILPTLLQVAGLLIATYSGTSDSAKWGRYVGLLIVGFGLGPTVPITMTWTAEIFQRRHGEIGVAAATALVSGLGNCGSILTNYALFTGWPSDAKSSPVYVKSNWVMIGILFASVLASLVMTILLRLIDGRATESESGKSRKVEL